MHPADLLNEFPWLSSPARLMQEFRGPDQWRPYPWHIALDDELMQAGPGARLIVNVPPRHGKSELSSRSYPAWRLLLNPDLRVLLFSYNEKFAAAKFGDVIKQIIDRFGGPLGVRIRRDMKSKGQWQIEGRRGALECLGIGSGGGGQDGDCIVIDDMIKEGKETLSEAIMETQRTFYQSSVRSRLQVGSTIVAVGTRWSRRDVFGGIEEDARVTGEKWRKVRFPALCEARDCDPKTGRDRIGRRPGDALCPALVSKAQLLGEKATNPWWASAWQQDPIDAENALFKPRGWPRYADSGGHYILPDKPSRLLLPHGDVVRLCIADWAFSEKKWANRTAFGCFGLCPDGRLLILEAVAGKWSSSQIVPEFAAFCRRWKPRVAACEANAAQDLAANECGRYPEIPTVRRLKPSGPRQSKSLRAFDAVTAASERRILLPQDDLETSEWLEDFIREVEQFTGVDDDADDFPDILAYGVKLANQLRPRGKGAGPGAVVLAPGREGGFW